MVSDLAFEALIRLTDWCQMANPRFSRSWLRKWFRVNVRGLMVLVLIAGGGVGWTMYQARVQREIVMMVLRAGGTVRYDWGLEEGDLLAQHVPVPWAPRWLVDRLGVDYFGHVVAVQTRFNDAGTDTLLASVARLANSRSSVWKEVNSLT